MRKELLAKILFVVVALVFATDVMAQVPQGFNFQAVARDSEGNILDNQQVGVQVSVVKGTEDGEVVYTETHSLTTNEAGFMQLVIGEGTLDGESDFKGIDWASDNFFVALAIDVTGGTEYAPLGTSRLLSVPYALVAQNVVGGNGGMLTQLELNTEEADSSFKVKVIGNRSGTAIIGIADTDSSNSGVEGYAYSDESNSSLQAGVYGEAIGTGTGTHLGIFGNAVNFDASGNSRRGVYGQAASRSKYNYGTYGLARGDGNGDEGEGMGVGSINFGAYGYADGNSWSNTGIEGSVRGDFGKVNYGVHGLSGAGSEDSTKNYGVAGRAYGPGKNYGVYGSAWDGNENYAGWFDGEVVINGDLRLNGNLNSDNGSFLLPDTTDLTFLQLNNGEGERRARLLTSNGGANGQLYFYNANQQNTGWFGNYGIGGFWQVVAYNEDESYAGGSLSGNAPWNNNLPFYIMEGSSSDPYVSLVQFGGRLNDVNDEVPYFELQSTQRGVAGAAPALYMGVSNTSGGNDPDGTAGEIMIRGKSSPNVQISGQTWENSDLGFIQLWGSTEDGNGWYHNNVFLTVSSDGTDEWGDLSLSKTNITGQTREDMITLNGSDGSINAAGTITAASVTETSDKRFKTDITPLKGALDKVTSLNGYTYFWNETASEVKSISDDSQQVGVIAQEVEALFPQLVKTDSEGYKSVNYAALSAVLLEAVKELNTKVEALENENTELRAEVSNTEALSKRLAQIEKLLGVQAEAAPRENLGDK